MKRALLAAVVLAFPVLVLADNAPDLIIHHARVFTADPSHRSAEAVAIRGNRIVAVGTNAEVLALAGEGTKRINAEGRVVVPGFNDAHTHQGPRPEGLALSLDPDPTWALTNAGLVNGSEETPGDAWIYGTIGPTLLADPSVNAHVLDKVSGNRKVMLESWTGHGLIFSTAAMNALHIREIETRIAPAELVLHGLTGQRALDEDDFAADTRDPTSLLIEGDDFRYRQVS